MELDNISSEQLLEEKKRRWEEALERTLKALNNEQLDKELDKKILSEFQETYKELYGDDSPYDEFYPTWKEQKRQRTLDVLKARKGAQKGLTQEMYPSMVELK